MHYCDSSQTALWAGVKAWALVLCSLTMGVTESERILAGTMVSGILNASGTLTGREIGQLIEMTKKVLWTSYQTVTLP